MKLMLCLSCGDVVCMRPEPRSCACGAASGRYLEDGETVEQTAGTVSIALHNHDLRHAVQALAEDPSQWSPFMVMRAYVNPHCERDVRYAPRAHTQGNEQTESTARDPGTE